MDYEDERSYSFKFIPDAQLELDDAVAYYFREANIKVANDFLTNVEAAIEMIAMWPDAGYHVPELPEIQYSRVPKFPYKLYFYRDDDVLEIVGISVYHTKRDEELLLSKLKSRIQRGSEV
jgi:plasmid stabilization system protein ParE